MQSLNLRQNAVSHRTALQEVLGVCPRRPHHSWLSRSNAPLLQDAISSPRILSQRQQAAVLEVREATNTSSFMTLMDSSEDDDEAYEGEEAERIEVEADESLKVTNLGLCAETVKALDKRGISSLFAIQKAVFQPAAEGRDMIGRAKTGSGKTLAFALPVVESLLEENRAKPPRRGRAPRCLVLAPTRELANQVAREFESVCPSLVVASFYGGVSAGPQMRDLMSGVDVAVGTPGRIMDLIERKVLKLDQVRFAILDEADQMLDMGFEEDMERILKFVPPQRQTLLFSATLPTWVNKVARKYLKNPLLVDLVGEANTGKLAETIKLMVLQVEPNHKKKALLDLLSLYGGAGSGAIVFVNTKRMADELQSHLMESVACEALHGDIPQASREQALKDFRAGKYQCLVATDVAARGLDIQNVDMIVHYDMPQDNEAFLHRSGRTGRAGKEGTAVVLYTEREARALGQLFRETKVTEVELVGSPDPADVMTSASRSVLTKLDKVDNRVIDFFVPAAERLLSSDQPSRVLAAALASMSGFRTVPRPRSLLSYEEDMVTLRLLCSQGLVDGWMALVRTLSALTKKAGVKVDLEQQIGKIKLLGPIPDGREAVAFDLPMSAAARLMTCAPAAETMNLALDRPKHLKVNAHELLGSGGGSRARGRHPPHADAPRGLGHGRSSSYSGSSSSGASRGRDGFSSSSSRDHDRGSGGGSSSYSGRSSYGGDRSSATRGGWGAGSSRGAGEYSGGRSQVRETEAWGASSAWGNTPSTPSSYYAQGSSGSSGSYSSSSSSGARSNRLARYNDDWDVGSGWDSAGSGWEESSAPPRSSRAVAAPLSTAGPSSSAPSARSAAAGRNAGDEFGSVSTSDSDGGKSAPKTLVPKKRAPRPSGP